MRIHNLSHQDAITLLEIINDSLACASEEEVVRLMARLADLLPYEAALSCLARSGASGGETDIKVVNVDYPEEYLAELSRRALVPRDPVFRENFKSFGLQYWADTITRYYSDDTGEMDEIISLAEDYGFARISQGCGYAYGVRNQGGTEGSFFCYHGLERCQRTEEILSLVIPHFHAALVRLVKTAKTCSPLTPKETEILKWLKKGKTSWETSVILGISERTVKFHISNILHKLDASTRTHAVAIAMEQGLVDLD